MIKNILFLFLLLQFSLTLAQSTHILNADGKLLKLNKANNLQAALNNSNITGLNGRNISDNVILKPAKKLNGIADTLNYSMSFPFTVYFFFHSQDVMMQYFVAPADLVIKAAGFSCSNPHANASISLRLVKLNWKWDDLINIQAPFPIGFYPSDDSLGNVDPFGENAIGEWQDSTGGAFPLPPWSNNANPDLNTFEYDLWSDSGIGWQAYPHYPPSGRGTYQWVEMSNLGFEPTITAGEVFAVVISHNGTRLNEDGIAFYAEISPGVPGWKFYEDDHYSPGNGSGWWVSLNTFDFAVAVEFPNRPPAIDNITQLKTTISTEPRTVEATIFTNNPGKSFPGIEVAEIHYSIDSGATFTPAAMTNTSGDLYSGEIPGQQPGTYVVYKVIAIDSVGNQGQSVQYDYKIFQIVNSDLLVIFNGGSEESAEQLVEFYLNDVIPAWDLWAAYGPVGEFINAYDKVLEIQSEFGPEDDNRDVLKDFINSDNKKLMVVGQEVLGYLNEYTDSTFLPGDYEYDVLGIWKSYNDVNYEQTGDELLSSVIIPQNISYGDSLYYWLAANPTETLLYYPTEILGSENRIDQFYPRIDIESEVFLHSLALDSTERPSGHNYVHPSGTEIFFMACDPLSFVTDLGSWLGSTTFSPIAQFFSYHVTNVNYRNEKSLPEEFILEQNYPNPFNPSTKIKFTIPLHGGQANVADALNASTNVLLNIYDILGNQITTIVNEQKAPGNYEVEFDGSGLPSGLYIYKLQAGNYKSSKKMLLLK